MKKAPDIRIVSGAFFIHKKNKTRYNKRVYFSNSLVLVFRINPHGSAVKRRYVAMITYYRTTECDGCDEIEKLLHMASLEFECIRLHDRHEKEKHFSANISLPILKDGHVVYEGTAAITAYLHEHYFPRKNCLA
jgi:glutaredoxin